MSDWIEDYLQYTRKHEAPEAFHRWTAIAMLAAATARRVYIDRGFYSIYPGQLMIVLVAGSAILRKSTAAKIGISLLKQVPDITIITGKSSPEAFIDSLQKPPSVSGNGSVKQQNSEVLIFASELSAFLSKQAYTEALIPILTDLADAPDDWEFRTRGHGLVSLNKVCVTFLSASTPDWIAEAIPINAFGGGFMSRILFIYEDKTDRVNALPSVSDFDADLRQSLITRLQQIATTTGQVAFTKEARSSFVDWYQRYMTAGESQMDGYWGRRADHLLRVAMTMVISRQEKPLLIDVELLERANQVLADVERQMPNAFKFVGATQISKEQDNVIRLLNKLGGTCTLQEIMHASWRRVDITLMRQALDTLKAAGIVEEHVIQGQAIITLVR